MKLLELFLVETTEEDRALISLSSAIYNKVQPYIDADDNTTEMSIGKIGNVFDTSIPALNNIEIVVMGGQPFLERAIDDGDNIEDYDGKELLGFFEEDTNTIVLNLDMLNRPRMKTTITHELRHALDAVKSNYFPGDAKGYFTPRKKEHRKDDPYSTTQYRAQPAEINARFVEVLDILAKRIPQWYNKLPANEIRPQLMKDLKNLLVKFEIADLFPEKEKSTDYKRLMKRAYDFMQKEMQHIESQNGSTKATGNW